jgi:pimeloyl-ACP methyl ester carboxylesterase
MTIPVSLWRRAELQLRPGLVTACLALWLIPAFAAAQESDWRGAISQMRFVQSFSTAEINAYSTKLYSRVTPPQAHYAVDLYLLTFTSTDEDDNPIDIVAQLYIPRLDYLGEVPVYMMGSGTTGIVGKCAPSRELPEVRNWGNYRAHMLSYASQGYIGILPDYQGFNDAEGLHYYFVADLEGRVMLDAARAVYAVFENSPLLVAPSDDVFLAGYSQGGHAIFAATDLAPDYAPEINVRGVIGYGATTNVAALMRDIPYFTPYILYAYAQYYGPDTVDVARVLNPRWIPTFEQDVTGRCIDEMSTYYGQDPRQVYQAEFYDALVSGRLAEQFPNLQAALDMNSTGVVRGDVPSLILHGGADPIVTTPSQDAFVRQQCSLGASVTYRVYPGVHHFQVRQVGFRDALAWMQSIVDGEAPPSDCVRLLSQSR